MADYQPWYVGQTADPIVIPLLKNGAPEDLTNVAANKIFIVFQSSTGVDTQGTGIVTVVPGSPPNSISYKFSPGDVAAEFTGKIFVKAYFPPSGGTADEAVWDPIPFTISKS